MFLYRCSFATPRYMFMARNNYSSARRLHRQITVCSDHGYGDVALLGEQLSPGVKGHAETPAEAVTRAPAVPEPDQPVRLVDSIGDDLVPAAHGGAWRDRDKSVRVGSIETRVPAHARD